MSSTSSSYTPRPSRVRSPPGPAPPIPPITPASLDAGINRLPPPPPRPITRGRGGGGGYRDETPANQIKDLLPPIRPRPPKLPAWSGSEERLWQEFLAEGPPNQPKYWKEAMAGWDFDENGVPIDPSTTDSTTALIPPYSGGPGCDRVRNFNRINGAEYLGLRRPGQSASTAREGEREADLSPTAVQHLEKKSAERAGRALRGDHTLPGERPGPIALDSLESSGRQDDFS
ncbi:hypothetical protein TYRP_001483 [Tyrophagus putrescentiae]|nr:hypothetical protein TYRP_001483 [Tyrophagus putrescentiae]